MALTAAIIGGGLLAGGGSIAGGMLAAPGTSGTTESFQKGSLFRPTAAPGIQNELIWQTMLELGADPNEISANVIFEQVGQNQTPAQQRQIMRLFDAAQARLQAGDPAKAQEYLDLANSRLSTRTTPGAGQFGIENGRVVARLSGAAGVRLAELTQQAGPIAAQRAGAIGNLSKLAADFPMGTATDIENLRQSELVNIEREFQKQREQILQQANAQRINPAGILSELEERKAATAPNDSLARALQLLGGKQQVAAGSIAGIQGALSPQGLKDLLPLLNLDVNSGSIGAAQQQAFANLVGGKQAASAQAQGAGVAGGGAAFADTANLFAILQMFGGRQGGPGAGTRQNDPQGLWNIPGPNYAG